ncbi:MAG: O-antigen ligase family protein [bacterium]|nr:O-antigen ligase family protein [bacterium]
MYQPKLKIINLERYLLYVLILSMATYAIPWMRIDLEKTIIPIGGIFLLLLCFLLLIRYLYTKKIALNKVLIFSLFLLYFSIVSSSFFPISLETERIIKSSIFMILPILFTQILNDYKSLKIAIYSIIIVGIILGIYGFYNYFTGNIGGETEKDWWWTYARYYGIHYLPSTRNSDIYYIAIPFIFVLTLLFFSSLRLSFFKISLLLSSSIMFFLGILLSFSRGVWFSLAMTITVFLFLIYKGLGISKRSKLKFWLLTILIIIFLIVGLKALNYFGMYNYFIGKVISILSPETASYYLEESISNKERIEIIKATFNIIINNPFGVGQDNLRYFYPSYGLYVYHPENSYLHILAENGLFGFIGYLIFIFYPLVFLYRKIKEGSHDWVRISIFLVLIYLAISYMFNVEVFSFYNWIIHSIIWSSITVKREHK